MRRGRSGLILLPKSNPAYVTQNNNYWAFHDNRSDFIIIVMYRTTINVINVVYLLRPTHWHGHFVKQSRHLNILRLSKLSPICPNNKPQLEP